MPGRKIVIIVRCRAGVVCHLRAQIRLSLHQLLIKFRRLDLGEKIPRMNSSADIGVPALQVAGGVRIDWRVRESLRVSGQRDLFRGGAGFWRNHIDRGNRRRFGGDDQLSFGSVSRVNSRVNGQGERCARARFPVAPVCPHCGAGAHSWARLSGAGIVHSWVRYQRGYLPEFEPLMPYEVLCVSLQDGPRVFGRLLGGGEPPSVGMAVQAIVERFGGGDCVLAFRGR